MSFWAFLDRRLSQLPGWPSERQWVTVGLFVLTGSMLKMAEVNPKLWDVKLFEILIQAIILTGIVNMVLAFHFSANQGQQQSSQNTHEALKLANAAQSNADDKDKGGKAAAAAAATAGAANAKAAEYLKPVEEMTLEDLIAAAHREGVAVPDDSIDEAALRLAVVAKRAEPKGTEP